MLVDRPHPQHDDAAAPRRRSPGDDLGRRVQRRADRDRSCAEPAIEEVAKDAHARSGRLPNRDVADQHRVREQARRARDGPVEVGVEREAQAVADDRLMQGSVALGQRDTRRGERRAALEVVEERRGDGARRRDGRRSLGGRRQCEQPVGAAHHCLVDHRAIQRRGGPTATARRPDGGLHALCPPALCRRSPRTRPGSARSAPGGSPICRRNPARAPPAPSPRRRAHHAGRTTGRRRRPPLQSAPRPTPSPARPATATRHPPPHGARAPRPDPRNRGSARSPAHAQRHAPPPRAPAASRRSPEPAPPPRPPRHRRPTRPSGPRSTAAPTPDSSTAQGPRPAPPSPRR